MTQGNIKSAKHSIAKTLRKRQWINNKKTKGARQLSQNTKKKLRNCSEIVQKKKKKRNKSTDNE